MKIKNKSSIALILTVGIIAILALIAVGFSTFTRLELRASENFANVQKAELIAEAGIARAVNDLKYHPTYGAKVDPYDTMLEPWNYGSGVSVDLASAASPSYGSDISYGGGTYRLKVIDCGALININTPLPDPDAESDLKNMIEQLGITSGEAQNLINYRKTLADGIFASKEEIKLAAGIGEAKYNNIKDFITLFGDEDDGIVEIDKTGKPPIAGHTRKSFVNVNTAPVKVLQAVFRPMVSPGAESEADALAAAIDLRRSSNPFDGVNPDPNVDNFLSARGEFERFLEYAASLTGLNIISSSSRDAIIAQSDPNIYATNSTKLGFDANGCYEIEAIGNYLGAKKKIKQALQVFRRIYQTTKNEFIDKSSDVTRRISWKNSCPVDFTILKAFSYADDPAVQNPADCIYDSLKLGFWDNFSEDYIPGNRTPDASGVLGNWKAVEETFTINASEDGMLRTWPPGGPSGASPGVDYFPKIELDADVCIVDDFALIAHGVDETSTSKFAIRDNLPWPAIPKEWSVWAPPPSVDNCPDAVGNQALLDNLVLWFYNNPDRPGYDPTIPYIPYLQHQQFLNTLHIQFGGYRPGIGVEEMSAIFCNNIQDKCLNDPSQDAYQQWVNYDGSGYIYFCPGDPSWGWFWETTVKPQAVLQTANVMVTCNTWIWTGHAADQGTQYFPIAGGAYQAEKTFHVKAFGNHLDANNEFRGEVYFSGITRQFNTTEAIMVGDDRYFKIGGLGNLPDVDYFRVVPEQGVYTSTIFNPTTGGGSGTQLEWGTIRSHVSLPGTASPSREPVYLTVSHSAITIVPEPDSVPTTYIMPSGGPIGTTSSQAIAYQAYLFSDKGETVIANTDFEQAPVVEDVTITYLPRTLILYQSKI